LPKLQLSTVIANSKVVLPAIKETQLLFSTTPQKAFGVPVLVVPTLLEQYPSNEQTRGAVAQVFDAEKGKSQGWAESNWTKKIKNEVNNSLFIAF